MKVTQGCVFDIQRFSVHDGPGIRTIIFLKGCSLHCFWCQNPEGIHVEPEIMYFPERCIACAKCALVCPVGAQVIENRMHYYLRDMCTACGKCTEVCCSGALQLSGKVMSVQEVMHEVLKDRKFYEISGGGVTLSGGDVTVQHEFARAILERCKAEGLHTAIETAANCKWEVLEDLLPMTDLVIMDIKLFDHIRHMKITGVSNKRILENAQGLSKTSKSLIIRTPIIPDVNDNPEEIGAIAKFISTFTNLKYYELLPFHRLGDSKYRKLGLTYAAGHLKSPTREKMDELAEAARKFRVHARVA